MIKHLFITLFLTVSFAHAQADDKENLKQINRQLVSSYKNQKFDEAAKFGQQAVDLSIKIYGKNNRETAVAFTNLGVIYREKKKFRESVESLQKAVAVYESIPDLKSREQVTAYETLAFSQILSGKEKEAEANYLKAIETAENKFGKESKESFSPTFGLGNFYAREKEFDKADEFYLKSYALAIKNFGRETEQVTQIEDSRSCLTGQFIDVEREKLFCEARLKIIGAPVVKNGVTGINGSIINGKATSLPKPKYPPEARAERLGGTISVRVSIDEQGNVTEAKAICGHPILGRVSEEAARKAKFSPTTLEGKLVKVYGIIVYNYVP